MKNCVGQNCQNRVVFECKCEEPSSYCCANHIVEHLMKSGIHNTIPLIMSIGSDEIAKIAQKVFLNKKFCRDLKRKIKSSAILLINHLSSEAGKAISIISKLEKKYSDMLKSLVLTSEINKEEFEKATQIPAFNINRFPIDITETMKFIRSFYSFYFDVKETNDDKYAFFSMHQMNLLDLESLVLTTSPYSNEEVIGYCGMACKINDGNYFYYGGSNSASTQRLGNACIIDLYNKTCDVLPRSTEIFVHGGVCKGNTVYVFGGCKDNADPVVECQKFSIPNKTWTPINYLPIPSHRVSASLVSNTILVLGYQMPGILKYDETTNSFSEVFKMAALTNKYIFENWAFSDQGTLFVI